MNPTGIDANESVAHGSSGLPRKYLQRYALAALSVGVALGASLLLEHFHFRVPAALLLLFAVAISSWYAGPGPAVLAAILSTISFYWDFVEPVHTLYINRSEIPYFVIFTAFAALLSWFGTFRRRTAADLRQTHDQLKVERPKLGSRTIALLYFAFSSCWILFTDRFAHGLGLSNAQLLKVSEAKGILFISLSTLLMYVLVEKALRQRHSLAAAYWQLVETAQEGVWSVDAEGKTVFANENMAAILGTSRGEMIGKSILPFVPQDKKGELLNHLLRREQGFQGQYEFPFLRADGAQVWTLLRVSPVFRHGQRTGSLALVSDITERKRAEEALYRLNRELRAISNCNQTLLRATDEQSLLEEICRIVCEEAGYRMAWVGYAEHDEAQSVRPVVWTGVEEGYLATAGITWADTERGRGPAGTAIRSGKSCYTQDYVTDPRFAPWRESALQRGFRSGIVLPLKDEHANAFGCLCIYCAQPNAFTSEEIRLLEELAGDMAFGIVTLRSQAARKQAEQQVALLNFAVDNVREAVFLIDDGGCFHYVNQEACRGLGYSRAELLGMAVPDIDPGIPAGRWPDHWRDLETQRSLSFESRHRTRDGRIFPVEISGNYFEYGGRAYCLSLVRDITERKRAEESLRESELRFRMLFEKANDAIFLENERDEIIEVNQRACALLGYSREELLAMKVSDLQAPEVRGHIGSVIRGEMEKHGDATFESVDLHRSGRRIAVEVSNTPISERGRELVLSIVRDITERKRADEALRQSEAYLKEAQRLSHTGSWAFDTASEQYVYVSEEDYRIFGFDPREGLPTGEQVFRRIHPEDRNRWKAKFEKSLREKVSSSDEYRIMLPAGTVKHIHTVRHAVLNDAGDLERWVGTSVDITERKRAEEALRRGEAYLAEAQRLSHTGSWARSPLGHDYWSEEEFRIWGFDPQQPLPDFETLLQRVHPEDRDGVRETIQGSRSAKTDYDHQFRIVLPAGAIRHVHSFAHAILSDSGELLEVIGTTVDITERKRAEEALRRTGAYLADAHRLTHTGAWAGDPTTAPLYWSEEVFRLFGFDPQHGLPTQEEALQRVDPEDLNKFKQAFDRTIHEKVDSEVEFRIVLPDGTVKHVHAIGHPVLNDNGELVEVVGTTVDITERKHAEQELRESETRFRTFVDHAGDALFVYDLEHRTVVDVNREACESLGYTREELTGMTPSTFHVDSYQAEPESVVERAAAGETVIDTHWHRRKDGTVFPVEVHTTLVSYTGRRFLLMVARDIADRLQVEEQRERLRQLEADLAHIDRVSILGELAASIAHEVNQPLAGIVSSGSACLRWLAADPPNLEEAREGVRRIVGAGKHAGDVIARIRALTKRAAAPKEKLDLNETIREVLALVGDQAKRNKVMIGTQFADDISPVLGDQVQLQQVVLNLVMNGIEAMSSVGERERELVITTRNIDPEQVQVTVEDSGIGIDASIMQKIFDPFYTTKSTGMGMGLSISRSILQHHGGRLWATAKDGPGTRFHFTLPTYHEGESNAGA